MGTTPAIYEEDIDVITARIKTSLETNLSRSLAPGDTEVLIANTFAFELQLQNINGNNAFRQNLVDFSTAPMLDLLAALVGVTRQASAGALCTLQFDLVDGHNAVTIPAGTRVQSVDGKVVFQTNADVSAATGVNTVTVEGLCSTEGAVGNGYAAGDVSILLDPQAFIATVENTDTTNSGNDAETDDQLRSRVKLAPASFSVAGPEEAYEFFAKSAHPSIVDVACVTTNPGEVTLYPLCTNGTLPSSEILALVLAVCNDTKVRPQNDTVLSAAPTEIDYAIDVSLTTFTGTIDADVLAAVNAALNAYTQKNINSLGVDIVKNEIVALAKIEGQVYDLVVNSPSSNVVADNKSFTKCTGITVNITGHNDG